MEDAEDSSLERAFPRDMLNAALEFSTEWGENYQKPIDGRILEKYPELSGEDLERLKPIARAAESLIYSLGERELDGQISEGDISLFARRKYPWINEHNLYRLKNIAMFYARK